MNTSELEALRDETAQQLSDLLARHDRARHIGAGFTGIAADIASLSEALVTLDRRLAERRGQA